jgi:hypothetical protein
MRPETMTILEEIAIEVAREQLRTAQANRREAEAKVEAAEMQRDKIREILADASVSRGDVQ